VATTSRHDREKEKKGEKGRRRGEKGRRRGKAATRAASRRGGVAGD
jgi:hypothetical protein